MEEPNVFWLWYLGHSDRLRCFAGVTMSLAVSDHSSAQSCIFRLVITEWFHWVCVFLLCCQGSGVLVAMLLVGGGGGACCCQGGRGPEGGGGGWLLGGGGGGGIIPIGGGSRPTRKQKSNMFCHSWGSVKHSGFYSWSAEFDQYLFFPLKIQFYLNIPKIRTSAHTHRMSMRPWTLVHRGRRWLHPGRRQPIGIGRHGGSTHARHGRWKVVGTPRATMHAVEVPVLSWARAHPWGAVLGHKGTSVISVSLIHSRNMASCVTHLWSLVIVGAWGARSSSLGVRVSSTRWRDWSLPKLSHERQILLVHSSLVLGWLRGLPARCSVGSKRTAKQNNQLHTTKPNPALSLHGIITWCTCSQRRCGLLHHTWYRAWCWWCCEAQSSAKGEGS